MPDEPRRKTRYRGERCTSKLTLNSAWRLAQINARNASIDAPAIRTANQDIGAATPTTDHDTVARGDGALPNIHRGTVPIEVWCADHPSPDDIARTISELLKLLATKGDERSPREGRQDTMRVDAGRRLQEDAPRSRRGVVPDRISNCDLEDRVTKVSGWGHTSRGYR